MIKVLISGALGKMGKKVYDACKKCDEILPVCGVDRIDNFEIKDFPVYSSFDKVKENPDVVIDFSVAGNLNAVLSFLLKNKIKGVLCTTGYTENDVAEIEKASKSVAIFRSANMSLGINVLIELVRIAEKNLLGYDTEIIEAHHNKKADAPSGTALMLAGAIKEVSKDKYNVYGRNGMVGARDSKEIGIHSLRGGNIVGEHQVLYAGENETITLSHSASDRSVFADGAVKATVYIAKKEKGLFNMSDMISGK